MAVDIGDFHLDSIDELQREPIASTSRLPDNKTSLSEVLDQDDDSFSIRPPSFAEVSCSISDSILSLLHVRG